MEKSCSCGARDKHQSDAVDACGEIGNDLQACNAHDWCQIEGMSQPPLHPLANSSILVLPHYRNSGLRRDSVYCNDRHAYRSVFGAWWFDEQCSGTGYRVIAYASDNI